MSDELDYLSLYEEEFDDDDYKPIKPPFAWAGGKTRSREKLLQLLPYERIYVEPFGGSGAVLLSRRPVQTEVFNDRFSGIVDFYKCVKDPDLLERLIEKLEFTTYSREEWLDAHDSWRRQVDIVDRAALWYTMLEYSFSNMGRNFGRTVLSKSKLAGKLRNKLEFFPRIHERIKNVLLENCGWEMFFRDYNSVETVIYCDPPYLDTDQSMYKGSTWTLEDQAKLLKAIFNHDGFVALSGYAHPINDAMPWDAVHSWDVRVSVKGQHHKEEQSSKRQSAKEVLYIKEAYVDG